MRLLATPGRFTFLRVRAASYGAHAFRQPRMTRKPAPPRDRARIGSTPASSRRGDVGPRQHQHAEEAFCRRSADAEIELPDAVPEQRRHGALEDQPARRAVDTSRGALLIRTITLDARPTRCRGKMADHLVLRRSARTPHKTIPHIDDQIAIDAA